MDHRLEIPEACVCHQTTLAQTQVLKLAEACNATEAGVGDQFAVVQREAVMVATPLSVSSLHPCRLTDSKFCNVDDLFLLSGTEQWREHCRCCCCNSPLRELKESVL